ncbi:MAG TPA: IS200/IS605 family transposase [Nitrospiraceae bacterium]|nr:IS200/IS605 family transposase [Nitrospiraceae bacterium]
MEVRLSGHSAYRTEYHIVWIPKYRRRILNPGVKGYLKKIMPKILEELPGCEIIEQNIQVDHIHTVMIIPPKYAVSDVIGRIKQRSASMLRKKLSFLKEVYRGEPMLWSPGYFVSTVGIDEAKIIKYVQWQDRQDSGQTKFEF